MGAGAAPPHLCRRGVPKSRGKGDEIRGERLGEEIREKMKMPDTPPGWTCEMSGGSETVSVLELLKTQQSENSSNSLKRLQAAAALRRQPAA